MMEEQLFSCQYVWFAMDDWKIINEWIYDSDWHCIWVYRKQWQPILWFIFLLILSIIVSETLKAAFKIPLIFDSTRYGFPSGHTQFATIFYGWICYHLKANAPPYLQAIYMIFAAIILAYATTSIIHYGYHTWFDIMGGFVSGGILLFLGTRLTLCKPKSL